MTNDDHLFLEAFETGNLPFACWNHKAHIRMAWLYLTHYKKPQAIHKIRYGIKHYNSLHREKINTGYSAKTTQTWISMISEKIKAKKELSFSLFMQRNNELMDKELEALGEKKHNKSS